LSRTPQPPMSLNTPPIKPDWRLIPLKNIEWPTEYPEETVKRFLIKFESLGVTTLGDMGNLSVDILKKNNISQMIVRTMIDLIHNAVNGKRVVKFNNPTLFEIATDTSSQSNDKY
jgi:hypothetical protein